MKNLFAIHKAYYQSQEFWDEMNRKPTEEEAKAFYRAQYEYKLNQRYHKKMAFKKNLIKSLIILQFITIIYLLMKG